MVAMILAAAISALVAASPGHLSSSKISLHLIGHYTPGARKVVAAGPRVLKVLDLHAEMLEALRDYKTRWPQGKTVVRIYTTRHYERGADPAAAGRDFWQTVLRPALERLSPADRKLIDYLEGPNEGEAYPVWESTETAAWFARFWQTLAPLIAAAGPRPCVGSIPVGNPPGTPEEVRAKMLAFAPALVAARAAGGAWSYHAYSLEYTRDVGKEKWTSLRYRRLHDYVTQSHPELADLPLILTEAGIDRRGDRLHDGWQERGDAAKIEHWLRWFDGRLREDSYVLGATLFQCGDSAGWPSFEVEPITDWLAGYLADE